MVPDKDYFHILSRTKKKNASLPLGRGNARTNVKKKVELAIIRNHFDGNHFVSDHSDFAIPLQ